MHCGFRDTRYAGSVIPYRGVIISCIESIELVRTAVDNVMKTGLVRFCFLSQYNRILQVPEFLPPTVNLIREIFVDDDCSCPAVIQKIPEIIAVIRVINRHGNGPYFDCAVKTGQGFG